MACFRLENTKGDILNGFGPYTESQWGPKQSLSLYGQKHLKISWYTKESHTSLKQHKAG